MLQGIKQLAKDGLWGLVRVSGLPWLIREVWCRHKAGIVVYHDPEPDLFKQHLRYLQQHYHLIPLAQLVQAIEQQDWSTIPPKALVITIDDGHKGNYALLDTIRQYALQPTVFACSHIVDTQRHFWWMNDVPDYLSLKSLSREDMLQRLHTQVGYTPEKNYPDRQALNRQEILELQAVGVDFQAHTCFHPILPRCNAEDSQREISDCKPQLESLLKAPVEHFAYPNGDYSEREIDFLKQAGFKSARSTAFGWTTLTSNLYALKILDINEHASLNKVIAQLTGIFYWLKPNG